MWACILGYVAIAVSFYLYITRTAQIEPETEYDQLTNNPGLGRGAQIDNGSARRAA